MKPILNTWYEHKNFLPSNTPLTRTAIEINGDFLWNNSYLDLIELIDLHKRVGDALMVDVINYETR